MNSDNVQNDGNVLKNNKPQLSDNNDDQSTSSPTTQTPHPIHSFTTDGRESAPPRMADISVGGGHNQHARRDTASFQHIAPPPPRPQSTVPTTTPFFLTAAEPIPKRVAKTSDRLLSPPRRAELPPIDHGPRLTREAQSNLAARLSTQSLLDRRKKIEQKNAAAEAMWLNNTRRILPIDEYENTVQRLYYGARAHETEESQKLEKKYKARPANRKLDVAEMASVSSRLSKEAVKKKYEAKTLLRAKYIDERKPTFKKLTNSDLEESVKRLTEGGKR